jgi:hypothetical protein
MCEDFAPNFGDKRTGITTAHCFTLPFSLGNFFIKNDTTVVSRPPYSSDLVPCDFSVFHHFEVIEADSQSVLTTFIEHDFHDAFKKLQKLWELCIYV